MMQMLKGAAMAIVGAVFFAACVDSIPTTPNVMTPDAVRNDGTLPPGFIDLQPGVANLEMVEVCKVYTGGTGPTVNFSYSVSGLGLGGQAGATGTFSLAAGECLNIWQSDLADTVTVTETVPAGYNSRYATTTIYRNSLPGTCNPTTNPACVLTTTTSGTVLGNVAKVGVGGLGYAQGDIPGSLIVFTNTLNSPPYCTFTKGYWRNHPTATAAAVATLGGSITIGGTSINASQVQAILLATPGQPGQITFTSNVLLNLAQQVISAILNGGLSGPASVQAAIAAANAAFTLSANGLALSSALSDGALGVLIVPLDAYNTGITGPGHCTE